MGVLTQSQVEQFQADGFLNAGALLSQAEVEELSAELDRIIDIGPAAIANADRRPLLFRDLTGGSPGEPYTTQPGPKPVWQILNMWEASDAFRKLLNHPKIVTAVQQVTGFADMQVWHDQVQYKPADYGGSTTWHQDAPLWPSIAPQTAVSAWIPFDDAEVSNGCMWMVPGSHRWGDQIAHLGQFNKLRQLDDFCGIAGPEGHGPIETRCCPVMRGEVHLHHSLTWHGSPENSSPRRRRALAVHYMSSDSEYTGRAHVMQKFIEVKQGEAMRGAGDHFPVVCRNGQPVPC